MAIQDTNGNTLIDTLGGYNSEEEYLQANPGKHKMNLHLGVAAVKNVYKLIKVDNKKITQLSNSELSKCLAFKDDYIKSRAMLNVVSNQVHGLVAVITGYIDDKGMWKGYIPKSDATADSSTPHKIDYGLFEALPQIFEENSTVVDFGCGNADYIKHLIKIGFKCEAYDGNPNTVEMTNGVGKVLDLSKKFNLNKKFDYVMSLEVAEHIPKECEEAYVDNLIRHTGSYLITSWAIKGQGGDGHVNEQNEDYVLNLYKEKGMTYNKEVSESLRNVATLGWFKKTIFVFSK